MAAAATEIGHQQEVEADMQVAETFLQTLMIEDKCHVHWRQVFPIGKPS